MKNGERGQAISRGQRGDRLAGAGDGQDVVVARHVREAAEVDRVGELGPAGRELLVAAGGDGEGVARSDRERHGLPQLDCRGAAGERVPLHLLGAAGVGARGEGDEAAREPVGGEGVEAGGGEEPEARRGEDGAGAAEGGIVEIDAAAGIAEVGIAAGLVEAALGLLQVMREAAHLGGEGGAGAADLAEGAGAHQHALGGVGPVDAPDLDVGVVVEAGGEVVLVEAVGFQRGGDLQVVDGEAERVLDLGGGEAGGGLEGGAVEGEVAVVVGEAEAVPSLRVTRQHQASVVAPVSRWDWRAGGRGFMVSGQSSVVSGQW